MHCIGKTLSCRSKSMLSSTNKIILKISDYILSRTTTKSLQAYFSNMNSTQNKQLMIRECSLITKFLKSVFIIACLSFLIPGPTHANSFDFSEWDVLLTKYVEPGLIDGISLNTVDYGKLKLDPVSHQLENKLRLFSPTKLRTHQEKLAFWINVYNIFAVKIVTENYPLKSIKSVGGLFKSVWKIKAGTVGGKKYSLGEIEHGILRKMGDPRIHTAIVCASISCPNLSKKAYKSEKLNEQLDMQMSNFLANPNKGMRVDNNQQSMRILLSPIFDWFADDFKSSGGVRKFIKSYVPTRYKHALENTQYPISYMDYNWAINGS